MLDRTKQQYVRDIVTIAYGWSASVSVKYMTSTHNPMRRQVKITSNVTMCGIQQARRHLIRENIYKYIIFLNF